MKIKDIQRLKIEITNLTKAIRQCKLGLDSLLKMDSGHTQSEKLKQLKRIKNELTD